MICTPCENSLQGCSKCKNESKCTECSGKFHVIQEDGSCMCSGNSPNMTVDLLYGECGCYDGYFLTEMGCLECELLIPGCDECYETHQQTIGCRKCSNRHYKTFETPSSCAACSSSCAACSEKWEGCS